MAGQEESFSKELESLGGKVFSRDADGPRMTGAACWSVE